MNLKAQRLFGFPNLLRRFGQRVFYYLGIKTLLEEKFKDGIILKDLESFKI